MHKTLHKKRGLFHPQNVQKFIKSANLFYQLFHMVILLMYFLIYFHQKLKMGILLPRALFSGQFFVIYVFSRYCEHPRLFNGKIFEPIFADSEIYSVLRNKRPFYHL